MDARLGFCFLAAKHGRLDVLKFLRTKRTKHPWVESLWRTHAPFFRKLKRARHDDRDSNPFTNPSNSSTNTPTITQTKSTMERFLLLIRSHGFTWDDHAPKSSRAEILEWIRENEYEGVMVDGVFTWERVPCPWAEDDLDYYICMGDFDMVKTLVNKKHHIFHEHYVYSCYFGYLHILEFLLENDPNRDNAKKTSILVMPARNLCYLHTKKFIGKDIFFNDQAQQDWIDLIDQVCDELTYNDLANLTKSYV
jgi:hypothetical protein